MTARALRRNLDSSVDQFPREVVELLAYFRETEPGQRVRAVPGAGLKVPVWILGSSLFGAQLAAALGLPFAFASHFAPAQLMQAIAVYRQGFQPSDQLAQPHVMAGFNVFAADSEEEAQLIATSMQQAFVNLRSARPSRLQPPVRDYPSRLGPAEAALLEQVMACTAIGSAETVRQAIEAFVARTGVDELIIASQIFDHGSRLKSYEITASILADRSGQ